MTSIIVQVAMDEEAQPFLDVADQVSDPVTIGRAVHRGVVIGGATIVLVVSGIGMVNAADAVAGSVFRYGSEIVLVSAGSAGGLASDARVGDVVVGTEIINVEADARAFGYVLGQVPGMPASYPADEALAAVFAGERVTRAAMAAFNHGVRFAACRAISDLCAPDSEEFDTHLDGAAARSAEVVINALPRLASA